MKYKFNEMREKILHLLSEKDMTVTELASSLGISKATVSHHIERLQREGLVKVVREERIKNFIRKYYSLSIPNGFVSKKLVEEIKDSALSRDRAELFRNTVRLLGYSMLKISPHIFKKAGYEVGYSLGWKGANMEDLAEVWEKLGLGKTSCSEKVLDVEECYFCSGLPEIGEPYCRFDEGLIAGFLSKSKGKRFVVREVKCWGIGDELCEFEVTEVKN